jgi:feruloyl esterase
VKRLAGSVIDLFCQSRYYVPMNQPLRSILLAGAALAALLISEIGLKAVALQTPAQQAARTISAEDCSSTRLGSGIPIASIGEPVAGVTLAAPRWVAATDNPVAYCSIDGAMAPTDTSSQGRPINFRVILPASWSSHAVQIGGGGMNGSIPGLTGGEAAALLQRGFAAYGSESGHQQGGFGPRGGAPTAPSGNDWALSDEAMKNLGYMQMKKTHDAAMVLMERAYGARPQFNYYVGSSQGGREALTVAQRYPNDYNGVAANVPIVSFSSLMLGPELIRIQEKPLANWITPAKVEAIRAEFVRQCDKLDGLADGIINNYMACRAIFDVTEGPPNRNPWASKRCPNNVDPNPADTTAGACFTDGQISTLKMVYARYKFATPLANGTKTFGMWLPNTDPSGSGLIMNARFKGQEGAAENANNHSHLGILGVTGFLMKNLSANPLDYVEGGALNGRREEISAWLDATNPDLSAFARRGGKMIVAIGTNDTLASPGAQLDYYQSVLDKMGRTAVDEFARFYVIPQAGHGLTGSSYNVNGDGTAIAAAQIPSRFDRVAMLLDWVEKGIAPPKSATVTGNAGTLPLCSYPTYPKYGAGPATSATSYTCAEK